MYGIEVCYAKTPVDASERITGMRVDTVGQAKIGTGDACQTIPVGPSQRIAAVSWTHEWSAFGIITVDMKEDGKPDPTTATVAVLNYPLPGGAYGEIVHFPYDPVAHKQGIGAILPFDAENRKVVGLQRLPVPTKSFDTDGLDWILFDTHCASNQK